MPSKLTKKSFVSITGFIVDTEDEAVRAVLKLDQFDRQIVRKVFQEAVHRGRDGTQLPAPLLAALRSSRQRSRSLSTHSDAVSR
jgi:hypothetical protein